MESLQDAQPQPSGPAEESQAPKAQGLSTISNSDDPTSNVIDYIQKQVESAVYEINKITGVKTENDVVFYNVQWVAHTWIPESILSQFNHFIERFWQENGGREKFIKSQKEPILVTEHVIEEGQNGQQKDESDPSIQEQDLGVSNAEEHFETTCSKCDQVFYLKSNWDLHIMFCGKETRQEMTISDATSNSQLDSETVSAVSTISEAPPKAVARSFELIPLVEPADCESCTKRMPTIHSAAGGNIDNEKLLFNATKKSISEDVEIFECQECKRDFLCKHPVDENLVLASALQANDTVAADAIFNKKFRPYSCPICNRSFESANEMYQHEVKHSNTNRRYSCAKCHMKFVTRSSLQEHYNTSKNGCAPKKCQLCSKEFVHASHLKRHMTNVHIGVKPFGCDICSHEFSQKSDLQRHEKRHKIEGRYTCVKCWLMYDTIEELREHCNERHQKGSKKAPAPEQTFKCEMCPKSFKRKSHYTRHLTIHSGIKPHSCEHCGKSFNQKSDLKRHVQTHERRKEKDGIPQQDFEMDDGTEGEGEPPFICSICSRSFNQKLLLDSHMTVTHERMMGAGVSFLK
eukprot:TCONS_00009285-protein